MDPGIRFGIRLSVSGGLLPWAGLQARTGEWSSAFLKVWSVVGPGVWSGVLQDVEQGVRTGVLKGVESGVRPAVRRWVSGDVQVSTKTPGDFRVGLTISAQVK